MTLAAQHSGVTISGPTDPGREATLTLSNTPVGSSIFELKNASDVIIEHLTLASGTYGVYAGAESNSDNLTLRNLVVRNLDDSADSTAVRLLSGNDDATVTDAVIDVHLSSGIRIDADRATISRNTISANGPNGVEVNGLEASVNNNAVVGASAFGIVVRSFYDTIGSVVESNDVTHSAVGIGAFGDVLATRNKVSENKVGGARAAAQSSATTRSCTTRLGLKGERMLVS